VTLNLLADWCASGLHMDPIDLRGSLKQMDEEEKPPRWLTAQEERKLMRQLEINVNAARTPGQRLLAQRDMAIFYLQRYAGLRVEETSELETGDIELSERKGLVTVRQGKRNKRREIPLSSSARSALQIWLAVRADEPRLFGLSVRGIQKRGQLLAMQTGIHDLDCHSLRHTFAKSMVDAGRPLSEIQKLMGHKKLETTLRYVQPGLEDLENAVEAGELGRMADRGQRFGVPEGAQRTARK
jgi:integrase/recombinase XerC